MNKKVLLVGSSYSAVPILSFLKGEGLHVSVCGGAKGDPCHALGDGSFFVDYSDRQALLDVVQSNKFDFLVPTCNDYSYMSSAWVASQEGFAGFDPYEVARILHTKREFRAFTGGYGLKAPRSVEFKAGERFDATGLTFPVLVKPVDSFSGRGVTKVESEQDLTAAVDVAADESRSGQFVLEEFVEGTLHSHSAILRDQRVVFDVFVDEFCSVYPYQVDCSNHPSRLPETVQDAIRAEIERLAGHLRLVDGLLHTQVIVDGDDFWIIECMRRCPGDLYGDLVSLSTGVEYTRLFAGPYIGEKSPSSVSFGNFKPYGRHTISVASPMLAYSFSHDIPSNRVRIVPLKRSGEVIEAAPFDKLGILFAEFADVPSMLEVTPRFADLVSIQSP